MVATWEKKEGNEGVLTFEVSTEEFEAGLDEAFKKVVKDVQLPGFRKGKIPRKIFENRFGVESLYQDAIDHVLPDAYMKAVEEAEIDPVDQPSIDVDEIERGKPLEFTATVTVKPEVELGEYKGIEVKDEEVEVTDEEVDAALEELQNEQAELILKEEGTIEDGDTVVIDFEGFLGDEPFEGGQAENHLLEIGSGQFIPGFEEKLVGKETGEHSIDITFPEEYHAEELAGKDATFKVTVHEMKEKEIPALDDEFAKDVDDDVETLDELKTKKKEELQAQKEQEVENVKREEIIETVTESASVDIPEAMIQSEVEQMTNEFEQRLQQQGMTMEMYTQFSGQTAEDIQKDMKEDAEKRVKTRLTLEAIFEAEDLEVSDEDVDAEFEKMAGMYNMDVEQIKGLLGGNIDAVKGDLSLEKTIQFLLDESKTV